jgi:hypothetical protein
MKVAGTVWGWADPYMTDCSDPCRVMCRGTCGSTGARAVPVPAPVTGARALCGGACPVVRSVLRPQWMTCARGPLPQSRHRRRRRRLYHRLRPRPPRHRLRRHRHRHRRRHPPCPLHHQRHRRLHPRRPHLRRLRHPHRECPRLVSSPRARNAGLHQRAMSARGSYAPCAHAQAMQIEPGGRDLGLGSAGEGRRGRRRVGPTALRVRRGGLCHNMKMTKAPAFRNSCRRSAF